MEKGYFIALLLLAFLIAIISPELPLEYSEIPANQTENETYAMPLMSPQDDVPTDDTDERPGWWKHTGNSYVRYSGISEGISEPEISSSASDPEVEIRIFLNGQEAGNFPGPALTAGSELKVSYRITNCGDLGLVDVRVKDDRFGDVGECAILPTGESVTFELEETVQKGNFSSVGRVSGLRENSVEMCNNQSPIYYFGKKGYEQIPEFPTFALPVLVVLGLAFIFGRKRT